MGFEVFALDKMRCVLSGLQRLHVLRTRPNGRHEDNTELFSVSFLPVAGTLLKPGHFP